MKNIIISGDNIEGLEYLLEDRNLRGKIDLVYIAPPFATNGHFTMTADRAAPDYELINLNCLSESSENPEPPETQKSLSLDLRTNTRIGK